MQIQQNFSLRNYNTFGIETDARYFTRTRNLKDLQDALEFADSRKTPPFLLGGGSNVLFLENLDRLVIKNEISGIETIDESDEVIRLRIGAGTNWHSLVIFAVGNGWGGIENLSLIPGTVGAAPIQNIGAYGVELKEVFENLEAVNLTDGRLQTFYPADCRFGYRDSIFKRLEKGKWAITYVSIRLSKKPEVNTGYGDVRSVLKEWSVEDPGIADVSRAVMHIRQSKLPDPAVIGNAGSFFKNPEVSQEVFDSLKNHFPTIPGYPVKKGVKVPAGWLIESAGWKGHRSGRVGVHEKQALVLINLGGATGQEISGLAGRIQASVSEKFGISLEPEVQFIQGSVQN